MPKLWFAVFVALVAAPAAHAHDRWEYVLDSSSDDNSSTLNFLQHGVVQVHHDLDSAFDFDQDWFAVKASARHSYEARVNGGIMYWSTTCTGGACPRFDRVNPIGDVLTIGQLTQDDAPIVINRGSSGPQNAGRGMTVRWIADATDVGFLRARSDEFTLLGPEVTYDVSFRDTTYFAPRWNNSGTQVSVLIVQNLTSSTVTGQIDFFNAAGALLASSPLNLAANAVQILSAGSVPGLAGLSGSASIAHLGGYGALSGKVVSLEPATGFTFDTSFTPLPR
jgi:hypothetical protein